MKEVGIYSLGSPPAFSMSTSNDLYTLARLCHEELVDRYNANQQGITLKVAETSDLSTLNTSLLNDFESFTEWWEAFVINKGTEFAVNLLDTAPLITAIATGGYSEIMPILIGHLINAIIMASTGDGKGGYDNSQDVADSRASTLFDNLHIEINNDPTKGDVDGFWTIADDPPAE